MVAAVLTIVSMGVLTWKGATAKEALASEVDRGRPALDQAESTCRPQPSRARSSSRARAAPRVTRTRRRAARNLGAPDLTAIGSRNLGIHFQIKHLKCPSCVNPGSPMPPFASLGDERLRQLAIFLEASKGTH